MKSNYLFLATLVSLMIATAPQALAASRATSTTGSGAASEIAASTTGTTAKKTFTEKCAGIQNKLKTRAQTHGLDKDKHLSVYNNLLGRLTKFTVRAKAAGYDTAQIESDLATLTTKIGAFKTSLDNYSLSVAKLKTNVCGRSENNFTNDLAKTKELLRTVHTNAAAVREFTRTTIRTDLKELKKNSTATSGQSASTGTSAVSGEETSSEE